MLQPIRVTRAVPNNLPVLPDYCPSFSLGPCSNRHTIQSAQTETLSSVADESPEQQRD